MHGPNSIGQLEYQQQRLATADFLMKTYKKSLSEGTLTKVKEFDAGRISGGEMGVGYQTDSSSFAWDFLTKNEKSQAQTKAREGLARDYIAKGIFEGVHVPRIDALMKAGVTTALGYNFYDLRAPVALLYPVSTPFRNSLPRIGRVNDGYGTAARWMATRNPGYGIFAGVSEGNRNAFATPDNNQYLASYKELGGERDVTFTAQFAGEGFADNLADEHIRGLHTLFLQEEGIMINGNSGATGTGFKLGTASTPTAVGPITTRTVGAAGNLGPGAWDLPYTTALTGTQYIGAAVVYLTAQGNPANLQYGYGTAPSIATGLTPAYYRINADGSKDTINGGISAISAISATVTTTGSTLTASFTCPTKPGVFGYAWFIDVESANSVSLANAKFAGITYNPACYVTGTPTGTQLGTYSGSGPSNNTLATDNSYQPLEFDGLITYTAATSGATYTDQLGKSLTSQKNGKVTEIETILANIYTLYQAGVDKMWCDAFTAEQLDAAIRYSGTNSSAMQFFYTRDSQNNVLGGFVVSSYQSRYATNNPTGANAIPICIHPMIPPGTIYFEVSSLPPAYAHSRVPFVRGMLVQRDYYSIEWPVVSRQWTMGTYCHEVLAHYAPWIPAVLTGVGTFVGT